MTHETFSELFKFESSDYKDDLNQFFLKYSLNDDMTAISRIWLGVLDRHPMKKKYFDGNHFNCQLARAQPNLATSIFFLLPTTGVPIARGRIGPW